MTMASGLYSGLAAVSIAALLTASSARLSAQQNADSAIHIGDSDLGGVVTSAKGPEAGVWVIAETADLPTKFAKIVVTDDQGRYVLPDLPKASYSVWVRGYGLVNSPKVRTVPGTIVNLTAVAASGPAAAAEYYPALYLVFAAQDSRQERVFWNRTKWRRHASNPEEPRAVAGHHQNGWLLHLSPNRRQGDAHDSQGAGPFQFLGGSVGTAYSVRSGQQRHGQRDWGLDTKRALALFADWTDRIAAGELPAAQPPRPQGVERNVVISTWDWATPTDYLHDEISTHKRNPTVNANGLIYGSPEESTDFAPILDPAQDSISQVKIPVRDPNTPSSADDPILCRRRIGEARRSGKVRPTLTIQCSTKWGGCGLHPDPSAEQSGLLQSRVGHSLGEAVPARKFRAPGGNV